MWDGWSVGAVDGAAGSLDAQAGHRQERQERDRRINALAVEVLVAIDQRDAAETPRWAAAPDHD